MTLYIQQERDRRKHYHVVINTQLATQHMLRTVRYWGAVLWFTFCCYGKQNDQTTREGKDLFHIMFLSYQSIIEGS